MNQIWGTGRSRAGAEGTRGGTLVGGLAGVGLVVLDPMTFIHDETSGRTAQVRLPSHAERKCAYSMRNMGAKVLMAHLKGPFVPSSGQTPTHHFPKGLLPPAMVVRVGSDRLSEDMV